MKPQEEIREGLISKVKSIRQWAKRKDDPLTVDDDADDIINYLHSQGVVLKVENELVNCRCPVHGLSGRHFAGGQRDGEMPIEIIDTCKITQTWHLEPLIEPAPEAPQSPSKVFTGQKGGIYHKEVNGG